MSILAVALAAGAGLSLACFEHAKCDDEVLSKVKSPDGKHLVTLVHRTCHGSEWTYVKVETVPSWFGSDPVSRYEYLMSVPVRAPVTAVWRDSTHLEITSPAIHHEVARDYPPETRWGAIEVSYK